MKLTFIPAPGSPWRVIAADDPQPPESWAEWAPPQSSVAPAAPSPSVQGDAEATATPAPPAGPESSSASEPALLDPLPPLVCPDCLDRPQFYQARQQAGYYRSRFDDAKKREAFLKSLVAELQAEIRILKQRLFGTKSESRHSPDHLSG